MAKETDIKTTVHYMGATQPYKEDSDPSETVGTLKANSLKAFGLVEGGGKSYKLFFNKQELQNMNETLGNLAGTKKELQFDLEEFIVQG